MQTVARTDGLYRSTEGNTITFEGKVVPCWEYLRFYPERTVINTVTIGTPQEIRRWFARENTARISLGIGTYLVSGSLVTYTLRLCGNSGQDADHYLAQREPEFINQWDYEATIEGQDADGLLVQLLNHDGKHKGPVRFEFLAWDAIG